jgi:hypothetical protein
MTQSSVDQLTPLQQAILKVVSKYPCRFSRSGLAKMLVGAKSWQDTDFLEYGRFSAYRRKDILFQVDVLLQQGHMEQDDCEHLIIPLQESIFLP